MRPVCHCGSYVDEHTMLDNHSPVEMEQPPLTPADRAALYNARFPDRPGLSANPAGTMVGGTWTIGACYKNSNEEWAKIPGWNYSASSHGRVRNDRFRDRVLTNSVEDGGYFSVELHGGEGGSKRIKVHRLVCTAFHGEPLENDLCVRHLDGNPTNNTPNNLRWGTLEENAADRDRHGRTVRGEAHHKAATSSAAVDEAREAYRAHMRLRNDEGFQRAERGFIPILAESVGLSISATQKLLYGVTWRDVPAPSGSPLYGAYPRGYLERVHSMFPDARRVLHAFSGGLTRAAAIAAARMPTFGGDLGFLALQVDHKMELVDIHGPDQGRYPTWQGDVLDYCALSPHPAEAQFDLILADPPYGAADAEKYDVKMPNRREVIAALRRVAAPGCNLVWLDTQWPMHSKEQWKTWAQVGLVRSTNHRVRLVTMLEAA